MSHLLPLLIDALATGVQVRYGRIVGRAGYVDPDARLVTINPDAAPADQLAALTEGLRLLADASGPTSVGPTLAHSVAQAEEPTPRRVGIAGSARTSSGLRVVG